MGEGRWVREAWAERWGRDDILGGGGWGAACSGVGWRLRGGVSAVGREGNAGGERGLAFCCGGDGRWVCRAVCVCV